MLACRVDVCSERHLRGGGRTADCKEHFEAKTCLPYLAQGVCEGDRSLLGRSCDRSFCSPREEKEHQPSLNSCHVAGSIGTFVQIISFNFCNVPPLLSMFYT